MFYSKSTGGFYAPDLHGDAIPADAVEISDEQHARLLEGQSSGKRIVADPGGNPILADPPAPTLAQVKDEAIARIDAARDAQLSGGFAFNGIRFDSDDKSVRRISGAVLLCLIDPEHSENWITQDNSRVVLSAVEIKGLGLAAANHERETLFKARALKDQIEAASSKSAVNAIAWS